MDNFKLTIELLPQGAWNNDLSKTLPKKDWDVLRQACYNRANHKCQICGYETHDLDAHEVWGFNVDKKTQTLKNIIALCSRCHGVKHMRNSERLGFGENAKKHFIQVNNCSELDFISHYTKAKINFEEQNKVLRWEIVADLSKFGGENIELKEKDIPFIQNPYTPQILDEYKNVNNLKPQILNIIVDNYSGTITVLASLTNKINWYVDDVVEVTKFNYAGIFKTSFCVKELSAKTIHFELIGDYGKTLSLSFELKSI